MSAEELTLIVNPGARRGRSTDCITRAESALRRRGVEYRIIRTQSYEEIESEARRAREEGSRVVVSAGGDGTNRGVATALAGSGIPLGVLPCGRGNDLARALGIPLDAEAAVDVILSAHTRTIDLGYAQSGCFITVATLGIDSEVSERVRRQHSGAVSRLTYPLTLLSTLVSFKFPRVVLEGDFGRREEHIVVAATANTPFYGGGMKVAPAADPTDGYFHVCLIRALPRLKLLALFPSVYRGSHIHRPEVEILRTRILHVTSEEPLPLLGDGEPLGSTPVTLEVRPRALEVCVPESMQPVNQSSTSSSSGGGCAG